MSTTTISNPINQSKTRMPSARAFHIFRLAEIQGQTHKQIAELYKVSRRRISQIVERVRSWLAQHPCEDPQIATELQAKRLGQHLEQMRLEDIIQRAREQLTYAKPTLDTVIDKADGTKTIICREQPFNVQLLKTYLRAVEALGRINARPEIPLPPPPEGAFPWLSNAINEVYEKWYHKICAKQNLKPDLFCNFVDELEAEMLKAAKHQQELAARPPAEAVDPHSCAARHLELPADLPPSDLDETGADEDRKDDDVTWEGEAPAEPPVGNALCGVPCARSELDQTDANQPRIPTDGHRREAVVAGSEDNVRREGGPGHHPEGRAPSPGDGHGSQSGPAGGNCTDVGRGSPDPAPDTTEDPPSPETPTLDLGPGTLDSPPTPSIPSLREGPTTEQTTKTAEAATDCVIKACVETSPTETSLTPAPPSPKNQKREAPRTPAPVCS